ncbi:MAG: hypothetical protein J4451_00165 [DPANN group archaeon]|nr:hypothetical protein [DPANN group archaeon]
MTLRKPGPGDKLAYFTRRTLAGNCAIMVWKFEDEDLANIEYTCPHCKKSGEKQQLFEREKKRMEIKGKKKTVDAFTFACDNCGKEISLEKWVKKGRKKAE